MTLIFWKAPVVDDPDAAKALLQEYYDKKDDSAFEPSEAIARVREELLRRFPDDAAGEAAEAISPWAVFPRAEGCFSRAEEVSPGAEECFSNPEAFSATQGADEISAGAILTRLRGSFQLRGESSD